MLKSTFMHIPSIGKSTEEMLWKNNIMTWGAFIDKHGSLNLSEDKKNLMLKFLKVSEEQHKLGNYYFFADNIPKNLHWRAYPHFKCCYLDIETTGLDKQRNKITTIGLYDGGKSRIFIQGIDLEEFKDEIKKYEMIVTFNGRCFDLPFITAQLGIEFNQLHIDLRFLMKDLGYTGGLKKIEREIGICRDNEISDVDGREAVRLWYKYKAGDKEALNTLVEYNKADIENLKVLMEFAFEKAKENTLNSI